MKHNETTKKYQLYFETAKRVTTNEDFIRLTHDAPQILQDMIRNIQFDYFDGCLANDWIYKTTLEAFEGLHYESIDDVGIECDTLDSELAKWLLEPFAEMYCQEAQAGYFCSEYKTIFQHIEAAQYLAKKCIFKAVNDFIELEEEVKI